MCRARKDADDGVDRLLCCTGDAAEVSEEQAIRRAVEKRIESLDDSFIGAVRAFEVAARAQSMDDIAGMCSSRNAR